MALLRRMRHVGGRARLTLRSALALLIPLLLWACERSDPRLRPEQVLKDSLQLGDEDRVHRVQVLSRDNHEALDPESVTIRPGDYVEFVTEDHRVHAVAFELDSLAPDRATFLRRTGQEGSPPLVVQEARFVVTFADAPLGRYPFVLTGNGVATRGAIVVGEPGG